MDYKKKYEDALKRAKIVNSGTADYNIVTQIFPELKESEDDMIRNFISHELACLRATDEKGSDRYEELTNAIAWLEMQGNQKSINKGEPKFKVGDWITDDGRSTFQILKIENEYYITDDGDKVWIKLIDKHYHLWTIQDAKDGDILATDDGICIFDGTVEEGKYPFAYCGITERGFGSYDVKLPFSHDNNVHPATKEQRDTLLKAMADAGYEWNADGRDMCNDFENYMKGE